MRKKKEIRSINVLLKKLSHLHLFMGGKKCTFHLSIFHYVFYVVFLFIIFILFLWLLFVYRKKEEKKWATNFNMRLPIYISSELIFFSFVICAKVKENGMGFIKNKPWKICSTRFVLCGME